MDEIIKTIITPFLDKGWIFWTIVCGLAIIGLKKVLEEAVAIFKMIKVFIQYLRGQSDEGKTKLSKDIIDIAKDIEKLLIECEIVRTPTTPEEHKLYVNELMRSGAKLQRDYSLHIGPRVSHCISELRKYRIEDEELNSLALHPTNPIGLRMVAHKLGELGAKLGIA